MLAATFHGPREIRVGTLPDPVLAPGEALIRVRAAGICGGDLHEYRADEQLYATPYPRPAQGHELAGDVVDVGEGVETVAPGDRVAVQPMISCGDCTMCAGGRWSLCLRLAHIGVARSGGFAELCVAPAENLFRLPSTISYEEGALADCTAVAVHALARVPVSDGVRVVVLGTGAIGQATAQLARMAGGHVTVVGTRARPLELARELGAHVTVDLSTGAAPPHDAEVVFETAGGDDLLERALDAAGAGATIGLVGESFARQPFELTRAMERELTIAFVWSHDGRHEYAQALEHAAAGRVCLERLVTHRYPLQQLPDAFASAADRSRSGAIKVMVTP